MVSILYGRAGTGKTYSLIKEAQELSQKGTRVFFVVPEQLSMTRERELNSVGLTDIEVLSFSRLSNTVFRALGGTAKKLPDSAMCAAAIYRAVKESYSELSYYKKAALTGGFILKLQKTFAEFDTCRLTLKSILSVPSDSISASTVAKYRDLFTVYDRYKSLWDGEYKAPGDDITLAAGMLELSDIFSDAVFIFDGFYGFTKQQLDMISQIVLQAAGCLFAFTTDCKAPLFSTVTAEARKIADICKRLEIPCVFRAVGDTPHRLKTASQRFMEKYFFENQAPVQLCDTESFSVYAAKNRGRELNFIACKIKNDVLSGKYRYRDIAVLSPDGKALNALADTVFSKHGVPVFTDSDKSLLSMPITAMVLSASELACDGFTFENVFSFLKTGLAGISFDDISLLENYIRTWRLRGEDWLLPKWSKSPSGLSKNESDSERLEHINELKDRIIPPLARFCEQLKNSASCRDMLTAVCELFDSFNVREELISRARYFENTGDLQLMNEYLRVYEIFINLLDSIDSVFCDSKLTVRMFCDIITVTAQSVTVSSRPSRADEVIFAGIGGVRTENIKCVYICGMNDGLLPRTPSGSELISDSDRRLFAKHGIATPMDFVQSACRERFDLYCAITSASHELVLSYSMFEATGETLLKSEFLESIERLTGITELTFESLPRELHLASLAALSELAAAEKDSTLSNRLFRISGLSKPEKSKNSRLERDIVYGLYSKNLHLSFSGVEEFVGCPFKFFIHRGLRAAKNEPIEMDPANIGTFIHYGLERLLSDGEYLNGSIEERIEKISSEYYNTALSDCKGTSKRFDRLFSNAKNALKSAVLNVAEEIQSSDFRPFDFEIDISEYTPPFELPDGCTLTLVGSIDRVDLYGDTASGYAKIIDYKSGSQEFSLKKIYNGLSMQLPIYASAVKSKFPEVKIAAMYYLKVGVPTPELSDKNGISDREYREKTGAYYKRDGVFNCDLAAGIRLGDDIATLKSIKSDRLFTQEKTDALIAHAKRRLCETGSEIMSGNTDITPICDSGTDTCLYCDLKDICKIGRHPEYRKALELPPSEFPNEEVTR